VPAEPPKALKESGYVEKISKQRGAKNAGNVSSYPTPIIGRSIAYPSLPST
jgi:hypothetical protein